VNDNSLAVFRLGRIAEKDALENAHQAIIKQDGREEYVYVGHGFAKGNHWR
jgi:hypothetical protein